MKLATLDNGTRDGRLVVVSGDLTRCTDASFLAATLQDALDDWARVSPHLAALSESLEHGAVPSDRFHEHDARSPLPRAYQWVDGSAYVNHVELVRKARGAEMPASFWTDPLMYQGGSDSFLSPRAPIVMADEAWGIDMEGEVAVIVDDVPMGADVDTARAAIRLVMLVNDVSLRGLIPAELGKGFGFFQSKPSSAFSPVAVTPDELIHGLLKSDCELLWFGGIGTYIKASNETNADAGDRANDAMRINGVDLKAKVIGEGANLGLTQAGRIEAALNGVRLNTDAIDNSAGVDSSDHEVNIKILCTEAMRRGALPSGERNTLLASMTDDVAEHVLAHNYSQTGALSLAEERAKRDHLAFERLMVRLEERGVLDRRVEGLPSTAEMTQFEADGRALTRPEIAVLMAWTKIVLFDDLVASDVPDDPYFQTTLRGYFPEALLKYQDVMEAHRLKREIICTVLANRIVDIAGPVFLLRLREQSGAANADIVAAFEVARAVLDISNLTSQIEALDNKVPSQRQHNLHAALAASLRRLTHSVLTANVDGPIAAKIENLTDARTALSQLSAANLPAYEKAVIQRRTNHLAREGVPAEVAEAVVSTRLLADAPLVTRLAANSEETPDAATAAYLHIGDALSLDRLRAAATTAISDMPHWDRLATRGLIRELEQLQADAAQLALVSGDTKSWVNTHSAARSTLLSEIKTYTGSKPSFAQFALAADAVRKFMQTVA